MRDRSCEITKDSNQRKLEVFYCLPMSGRTDDDILKQIDDECVKITELIKSISNNIDVEILCNYQKSDRIIEFPPDIKNENVYFVGRGVKSYMSKADIVVFGKNWESSNGCKIEKYICEMYGIKHFYI